VFGSSVVNNGGFVSNYLLAAVTISALKCFGE